MKGRYNNTRIKCEKCGDNLSKNEADESIAKWGKVLCYWCQLKERD